MSLWGGKCGKTTYLFKQTPSKRRMNITYEYKEDKNLALALEDKATVKDMLDKLNIPSNTVIVVRQGSLILEDESLEDQDTIKILTAISGG